MKAKLILTRFRSTFGTLRFDEKFFLKTYWVLHHIGIADLLMQFVYTSEKIINLNTIKNFIQN